MRTHHPYRVSSGGAAHLRVEGCRCRPNGQVSCTSMTRATRTIRTTVRLPIACRPLACRPPRPPSPCQAAARCHGRCWLELLTAPRRRFILERNGSGVTTLADAACWMVLCGFLVGPHGWGTTRPRLRHAIEGPTLAASGVLSGGPLSAASTGCRNVMKATNSRSKSPVQGDVGSPHRSHGWRNEKRS